jgi:ketosteroid isomerase-like protein
VNTSDALLIERACARLIVDSARFNDHRDWAALARLYTTTGVVVRPNGQRLEGREAIEAAYATGSPDRVTRHLCTNLLIDVDGPDAAHATTTVLIVAGTRSDPDVTFRVGEFADRFVRTGEGWRIAERRASLLMNT